MKKISFFMSIVAAVAALSFASDVSAQCCGVRPFRAFSARSARVYSYAPSYCGATRCGQYGTTHWRSCGGYVYAATTGYWTDGQCGLGAREVKDDARAPFAPTTEAPRRAAAIVDAELCPPCAEVVTAAPSPCETCGEYAPVKTTDGALVYKSCPTGACPLANGTRAAVASVSRLLDALNATRARYGLRALSFDATLTGGSQFQASYCASRGALIHGSGVAEILAQNTQGLETALSQWLNSPAHRALLLNPNFTRGGVAVHRDGAGRVWCAARFQ